VSTISAGSTLWPYFILIVAGFLPNELWRMSAILFSRGLNENSEILTWVKAVAGAILAIIITRLVIDPSAALTAVPLSIRALAMGVGLASFFVFRQSLLAGILLGELTFLLCA
jgi:hypothetical protein